MSFCGRGYSPQSAHSGKMEGKNRAMSDERMRFLAKGVPLKLGSTFKLAASGAEIAVTSVPLFTSIPPSGRVGAAATSTWHLVTAETTPDGANPWDACHVLATKAGFAFVEPDLTQSWPTKREAPGGGPFGLQASKATGWNPNFPPTDGDDKFWFRDAAHGEFDAALLQLDGDPGPGKRTRIAHLDTGYDPAQPPEHLSESQGRNFVDADFPKDASERSAGIFNSFSHGTGTLGLLAGKTFGCAPYAEIVPIRVANRVVLFSNSAVARAFDYVHSLCANQATRVHIATMSMGGLPSRAWAEAINALYDMGVLVVAAAGNNYGNLPTRFVVYPARFNRVVAAAGAMADGSAYADLNPTLMAGDYGPEAKMATAIAAYTPNVPWARYGEPGTMDFDGAGTSSATPQVAGAAALWIQKHRAAYEKYPEHWMRVEAVRKALFDSAEAVPSDTLHFGVGRLRANAALNQLPATVAQLKSRRLPLDNTHFAIFHVLLGVAPPNADMVELEASQVVQAMGLEARLLAGQRASVIDEMLSSPGLSKALRKALGDHEIGPAPKATEATAMSSFLLRLARDPPIPKPPVRRLRIFAYDPSFQTDTAMFGVNQATVSVRWEDNLQPGPVGEYLEVVDVDPASRSCYAPVDLNHPHILAESGLAPSEANAQFHQQMVYAVAMRTIARFERALGRKALWASRIVRGRERIISREYIPRLRIYPHALRETNAYYSSERMALLFGYFTARNEDIETTLPGSQVFCAVSHDIIAHEVTHALLDGLHPRYQEATNVDVLAFHEAFADIVALFQHFTMPEALLHQIKQTHGDLEAESALGQLAVQFGMASGMHGALRSAIGKRDRNTWKKSKVSNQDYNRLAEEGEPHDLGALLVSAVFAAFVTIYRARSADLIRLATSGTGVLSAGEISHDLAGRLASEAAKVADQVLNMCIRALDYCPPVDPTFGDYLRAIVTADRDLVPDDDRGYRVAFISAFRDRGILPSFVAHLAEDSLVWEGAPLDPETRGDSELLGRFRDLIEKDLQLRWSLNTERESAYRNSQENAKKVHSWLVDPAQARLLFGIMGFDPPGQARIELPASGPAEPVQIVTGEMRAIEVHSVRPSRRTAPDGHSHAMLVIEITQTFRADPDQERYRGGCTLLVDLNTNEPRYILRKRLRGSAGLAAQRKLRRAAAGRAAKIGMPYTPPGTSGPRDIFALLHRDVRN